MRNINVNYSALSELHGLGVPYQGRRAFTLFGACPWLSFRAFGAALAVIFRAFGAGMPLAVIFRAFGACLGLSYSAPSALALTAFLFKANNDH